MYQEVTPVTTKKETYTIKFNNALYHPHDGHMSIVSTTGFKINGDTTNEYFLDDDGSGNISCLLYTSPSPRDRQKSRMPSSA